MKSDSCRNRNVHAGQSMDMEWHVCLGDTSAQKLHKLQEFMSVFGNAAESFPDEVIFATMFNDATNLESQKVPNKCLAQVREVLSMRKLCSKIQTWLLVFQWFWIGKDMEMKSDHLTLQTVKGTNSFSG